MTVQLSLQIHNIYFNSVRLQISAHPRNKGILSQSLNEAAQKLLCVGFGTVSINANLIHCIDSERSNSLTIGHKLCFLGAHEKQFCCSLSLFENLRHVAPPSRPMASPRTEAVALPEMLRCPTSIGINICNDEGADALCRECEVDFGSFGRRLQVVWQGNICGVTSSRSVGSGRRSGRDAMPTPNAASEQPPSTLNSPAHRQAIWIWAVEAIDSRCVRAETPIVDEQLKYKTNYFSK